MRGARRPEEQDADDDACDEGYSQGQSEGDHATTNHLHVTSANHQFNLRFLMVFGVSHHFLNFLKLRNSENM